MMSVGAAIQLPATVMCCCEKRTPKIGPGAKVESAPG